MVRKFKINLNCYHPLTNPQSFIGRSDRNPMRFGKRSGHASTTYCDDYDCLLQERENQLTDIENDDQLTSLFGNDDDDIAKPSHKSYGEYIITK